MLIGACCGGLVDNADDEVDDAVFGCNGNGVREVEEKGV
jgi:hypothetical protein